MSRLGSAAQNLIDGDDQESESIRIRELNLMEKVRELSFEEDPADLAIMYEVTGY